MIDTIIFDLDGTLLDTLTDLYLSTNYTLEKYGLPLRSKNEVRSYLGNGIKATIERALPDDKKDMLDEVLPIFKNYYDEHKEDNTAPYDGIIEMISVAKKAGYKTAIVSNKYDKAVQQLKDQTFNEVDYALGEKEGIKPKPDPAGVLYAIEKLGSTVEKSVYVGDSEVDFMTANNSKLPFIAVSWGFRDKSDLIARGVKTVIDHPSQLIDEIKKLD